MFYLRYLQTDYIIYMAISNRLIELTPSTLHSYHFIKIVLVKISNDLHEAGPHRLFFLYILSRLEAYFTVDHLFPLETFSSHGFQNTTLLIFLLGHWPLLLKLHYKCSMPHPLGQGFSTGFPQQLLKHTILDSVVRGTDLFSLRLTN